MNKSVTSNHRGFTKWKVSKLGRRNWTAECEKCGWSFSATSEAKAKMIYCYKYCPICGRRAVEK